MNDKNNENKSILTPVDLRGHKTQDDFEYGEDFGLATIVTGDNGTINFVKISLEEKKFPELGIDKGCSCFTGQPEQ